MNNSNKIPVGDNHGWIMLHRKIQDHWLWRDAKKLKWWLDIILEVNHAEAKVLMGFELIDCKRGQSLNSLSTWSKRWRVDVSTVRNFFDLLKADGMIETENVRKTTRLTVCNYDNYNPRRHTKQSQSNLKTNRKQSQGNTNNNDKNENNDKNNTGKSLEWYKSNKDEIIKAMEEKFPNKDAEFAYNYFLEKVEMKSYVYKDYLKALCNWVKNDKFNQFPNKSNGTKGLVI